MKQLKLLFTVLFLAVLGLGNVWAEEEVFYTNTCPKNTSASAYANYYDVTVAGIKWKAPGNQYADGDWRLGGKSSSSVDRYLYTQDAIETTVTKIVATHGSKNASSVGNVKLDVYSTAALAAAGAAGDVSSLSTAYVDNGSITFTCPAGADWENRFYRLTYPVNPGTTSSNKYAPLKKVEFYYNAEEPTCSTPDITFADGVEVAKLTTDAAFTNAASVEFESVATGQTITYSVEAGKEGVATVNASTGEVTIVGAGSAKIYASVAADGDYCEKSASYTLTVSEPAFECGAGKTSFIFGEYEGFSSWGSSYEKKELSYTEADVILASANRSTATITDCPVTKGGAVEVKAKSGRKITSIHFEFEQWTTKAQTATLNYSTDGGVNYSAFEPAISSTDFTLTCASLPANTNAVKVTFSSSSNQVGIVSVCAAYTEPVAPSVATPELSVAAGTYEGTKNVKVSNYDADLSYFYTLDGTAPTNASTAYNHTTGIDVAASATLKVIAYDASSNASEVASAAYVIIPVYGSIAELLAAGAPTATGWTVKVTLTDVVITSFQTTKGVWVGDVELYGGVAYPNTWEVGGKLSGTLTCPWKLYGGSTKELCPSDWSDLEYTAPSAPIVDPEYASLAELIDGEGAPTAGGKDVKVTFTNDVITRITDDRKGIFFMVGEREIEVYCTTTCPAEWTVNGQVSGTLVEGSWKLYGASTWEIVVADWAAFEYTAYVSHVTGVTFANGSVFAGKTLDLATLVEIAPADASNKNVSFEIVSGSEYISLSEGVVTGVAEGSAVVRVTTEDGSFTDDATITVEAVSIWATTYTSNVTLSTTGGTSVTASKVKVNGEATTYDAIKAGTGSADGKIKVTLPLGTTKLHFHAVTWSGSAATATLSVKKDGDATELFGNVIRPNTGLSSNSPYTLVGDPTEDYYSINFGSALTEATTVVFDASVNRFAIYGVNVEKEEIELVSIAISGTATKTEYIAGDVFDPAGLVVTGTYSVGEPQEITEGIDWAFTPATLAVGTTSVSVVATVGEKSSEAFVVNDLTVAAAPLHADWVANAQGYANGDAIEGSAIKHETTTVATVTFNDGTNTTNSPKYYTTGESVRAYGGNNFVISALKGFTMKKIVLSFATGEGTNAITANVGEFATDTWTGEASAVTFTVGGTSGHRRIAGITVYYEGELATPTGIVLNTETVKKEFAFGEEFNSDNLVVKAVYSDESEEDVTLAAEVVAPDMSTSGDKTVTVNYLTFSETYTITVVAPTPVISVDKETIAFGNVNLNSEVEAKTVAVTLENLAAATAAISGEGAAKFAIDVTELTASGNITISVVTNEEGEYAATLTISGEGAESKTVALSMTVVNIAEIKQEDVTPAEIYASALTDVDLTATPFEGSALTITYSKGTNTSNKPGFFVSDKTIRTYVNNTITISSTTKNIYMVEISYKSEANADKGMGIFANNNHGYVVCDGVSSVELTATGTSRITNITVYYENQKEEVRGGLNVGMFGTICVDKLTLAPAGAHFYTLNQYDAANSVLSVNENTSGRLEAGVPYIFEAEGAEIGGVVVANSEEASDNNGLYAVLDESGYTVSGSETGIYGIVGNEVRPAANGARFPKGRCYIKLEEVSTVSAGAPARAFRVVAGPNTATGFELIEISADAKKVLINNHVYIQRDGKIYDIIGHIVK